MHTLPPSGAAGFAQTGSGGGAEGLQEPERLGCHTAPRVWVTHLRPAPAVVDMGLRTYVDPVGGRFGLAVDAPW